MKNMYKIFFLCFMACSLHLACLAQGGLDCGVLIDDFYSGYGDCNNCPCGGWAYGSGCHDCGGGWDCSSASEMPMVTYHDLQASNNGDLEVWAYTANASGAYGQGTVSSAIVITDSLGGAVISTQAASAYNPSVEATLSLAGFSQYADSQEMLVTSSGEFDSLCGVITVWNVATYVGVAHTKSRTDYTNPDTNMIQPDGSAFCALVPHCQPQQLPPTCNPSFVDQKPIVLGITAQCWQYYITDWLIVRMHVNDPWDCYPLVPLQNASGSGDPSIGSCTKK